MSATSLKTTYPIWKECSIDRGLVGVREISREKSRRLQLRLPPIEYSGRAEDMLQTVHYFNSQKAGPSAVKLVIVDRSELVGPKGATQKEIEQAAFEQGLTYCPLWVAPLLLLLEEKLIRDSIRFVMEPIVVSPRIKIVDDPDRTPRIRTLTNKLLELAKINLPCSFSLDRDDKYGTWLDGWIARPNNFWSGKGKDYMVFAVSE